MADTPSKPIRIITEKTAVPISLVVIVLSALLGLTATAVRAQSQIERASEVGDSLKTDIKSVDGGLRDLDRRVQRLEDAFLNQQSMMKEIRDDVKQLRRDR